MYMLIEWGRVVRFDVRVHSLSYKIWKLRVRWPAV